jgi:hypothetical protein
MASGEYFSARVDRRAPAYCHVLLAPRMARPEGVCALRSVSNLTSKIRLVTVRFAKLQPLVGVWNGHRRRASRHRGTALHERMRSSVVVTESSQLLREGALRFAVSRRTLEQSVGRLGRGFWEPPGCVRSVHPVAPGLRVGAIGLDCKRASRRGNAGIQPERRAGGRGWWAVGTWPSDSTN